jgi:hypothetical protein
MSIDRVDETVVTQESAPGLGQASTRTDSPRTMRSGPGWVLELVVIWAVGIFRREPA